MNEKEEIVREILEKLEELKLLDPDFTGSLFLHGDGLTEHVTICTKGNPDILNAAFTSQMERNPRFNQLIMSMIGSYLHAHPQEKEKLFNGMSLLQMFPISPN